MLLDKGASFYVEFNKYEFEKQVADLLIVEDDLEILKLYERILEESPNINKVHYTTNTKDAREVLNDYDFKCIISDSNLPGESGLKFLSSMFEINPDVKRVLVTADTEAKLLQEAINVAKVDLFLYKPIDSIEFILKIEDLIEKSFLDNDQYKAKSWHLGGIETSSEDEIDIEKEIKKIEKGNKELILVIDDLKDMRDLISKTLESNNYQVAKASNGELGFQLAKKIKPDLIITDWMMPKKSGPDLIIDIRSDQNLKSIPIILLTAKSDEESKLIGTDIGADSFLGKPFNAHELTSVAKNLLSLKKREKEVDQLNIMLTETVLKRYLSPDLVDKIITGEASMDRPAEMKRITVLFSDLSGFTKFSEVVGPEIISKVLNEYLTKMNDIIFKYGGTIDKFMGDAIMVLFGTPIDLNFNEQAIKATQCAIEMQLAMDDLENKVYQDGTGTLKMRIGIHQGDCVVGNFGSNQRSDYTAIGPTVNLASRIESVCNLGEIFITEEVSCYLSKDDYKEVGYFSLKGIEEQKKLYEIQFKKRKKIKTQK